MNVRPNHFLQCFFLILLMIPYHPTFSVLLGVSVEQLALQIAFTSHMHLPLYMLYNKCGCFPVIMLVEQTMPLIYLGKLPDLPESGCLSIARCREKKEKKKSRCPILTDSFEPRRYRLHVNAVLYLIYALYKGRIIAKLKLNHYL